MENEDGLFIIGLCFILFIVIILFIIAFSVDESSCSSESTALHLTSTWGPLQGCIAEKNGQFFPIDNLHYNNINYTNKN